MPKRCGGGDCVKEDLTAAGINEHSGLDEINQSEVKLKSSQRRLVCTGGDELVQ